MGVGQGGAAMTVEQAYRLIHNGLDSGRLAQAYVVAAPPRGAGLLLTKRVLSRLFCQTPDIPCGECSRCRAVERGIHPDVHVLEPQMKSRVIGMEAMRDFLREIHSTSFEGGWKGGVIVSADCLNASAANAFLKTLEEPPEQTVFFLLTDSPQRLMPTIISRCQRLSIEDSQTSGLSPDDRQALIEVLSAGAEDTGTAGAFGRADRLVSYLKARKAGIEKEQKKDAKSDSEEDIDRETLDARIGALYREWRHGILESLLNWYRDVFLLVCGGEKQYLYFRDQVEQLAVLAQGCTYRQALEQVQAVEAAVVQLNRNLPESLTFEMLFYKLIR